MVWWEVFDVDLSTWQKVLTYAGVATAVVIVAGLGLAFAYHAWEQKRKAAKATSKPAAPPAKPPQKPA